nr:MAG TPA: hypothetical protein [Caudoviricetes sp.]
MFSIFSFIIVSITFNQYNKKMMTVTNKDIKDLICHSHHS